MRQRVNQNRDYSDLRGSEVAGLAQRIAHYFGETDQGYAVSPDLRPNDITVGQFQQLQESGLLSKQHLRRLAELRLQQTTAPEFAGAGPGAPNPNDQPSDPEALHAAAYAMAAERAEWAQIVNGGSPKQEKPSPTYRALQMNIG